VLQFGDEILILPAVTQSNSSREFKEDGRQFLAIRRKINDAAITPDERRLMIHSLERYLQDVRNMSKGADTTSKGHLRRLENNVYATIRTLEG
jgi:hypothetical protein